MSNASGGRAGSALQPIAEIDVLWITAGLGCDGDTIAMTAATQPSMEDIVAGGLPWIPKVQHAQPRARRMKTATSSCNIFHRAAEGKLAPFILVVEGSIPNENNKSEGYWASFGTDRNHGPTDRHLRMDRPAGAEGVGGDRRRDLRHLWRNPCHGRQPHGMYGTGGLPGMGLEITGGHSDRLRAWMSGATR